MLTLLTLIYAKISTSLCTWPKVFSFWPVDLLISNKYLWAFPIKGGKVWTSDDCQTFAWTHRPWIMPSFFFLLAPHLPLCTDICWPSGPTLLCADISLVSSVISATPPPPASLPPFLLVSVTDQHFRFTPSVILRQEQPLSPGESRTLSFISAAPLDLISI